MQWGQDEAAHAGQLLKLALVEDLGDVGDVTSTVLLAEGVTGGAVFVARAEGVLAGLPIVPLVFESLDRHVSVEFVTADGQKVARGAVVARVRGPMRAILTGERTALNIVQRLSGVATATRRYVDAVAGLRCRILDTRKTTPGWRVLEKYAVRCGGGHNHRRGLFDGVLIKDNHLAALRGQADPIGFAVAAARRHAGSSLPVEVEVDDLDQLGQALAAQPDRILLDNMDMPTLREAVRRRNATAPAVQLEASGGVTLATVRAIAETGVDCISIGALTHSAPALDLALDYARE